MNLQVVFKENLKRNHIQILGHIMTTFIMKMVQ